MVRNFKMGLDNFTQFLVQAKPHTCSNQSQNNQTWFNNQNSKKKYVVSHLYILAWMLLDSERATL